MEYFICAKAKWMTTDRMTEAEYHERYLTRKFKALSEPDARQKARAYMDDFKSTLPESSSQLEIRHGDFEIIAFGQVLADP